MPKYLAITSSKILLLTFLFLQKETFSQCKPFYNAYASYNQTDRFYISQELGINIKKSMISVRYDYEALKHLIAYYGYSFSAEKRNYEYEVMPMLGFVADFNNGNKGYSAGVQGYYYGSKNRLHFYLQAYNIDYFEKEVSSFFYNWTEAGYDLKKKFIVGGSYILNMYEGAHNISYGPFAYKEFGDHFSASTYLLNFWNENHYFLLGVSFNL